MAAATVAGISLLSKDATVFILGGAMVIALDWVSRVNNFTNPVPGSAIGNPFTSHTVPVRATGGEPSAATYADAMSVA
jgi:hypothetical protein